MTDHASGEGRENDAGDGTVRGAPADESDPYGGVFGAIPYAARTSDSLLLRSYVLVGGGLAGLLVVLFGAALVVQVANTLGAGGGVFTFSRTFFIFVGFLVVAPLLAPILGVARRHRRTGGGGRYDAAMALAGYGFVLALFAGLIASQPECFTLDGEQVCRDPPDGLLAPVIAALYAIPPAASVLVPATAAAVMAVVHRRFR